MSNGKHHHIHLWVEKTDRLADAEIMINVLNKEERDRSSQFKHKKDRNDFITAHAFKRIRIAEHLQVKSPEKLRFEKAESGKPFLLDKNLQFNLSHSHGYIALAISDSCECAVDIEAHRNLLNFDALIKKTMSTDELTGINASLVPSKTFFDRWVLKEAFVKNSGIGLMEPFEELCTINELQCKNTNIGTLRKLAMFWKKDDNYSLAASCAGQGDVSFIFENRSYRYLMSA